MSADTGEYAEALGTGVDERGGAVGREYVAVLVIVVRVNFMPPGGGWVCIGLGAI